MLEPPIPASATLHSVQVGMPRSYGFEAAIDPHDGRWVTGFFKSPIDGPVFVGSTNLAGDGQADLENHGGVDKAVLAYSADHYPKWREELGIPGMPFGAFGENLSISGLSEESVCIGDIFRIGDTLFEVSQPRQPCWKLARRWRLHELPEMVVRNGRSGWYLRVLNQGSVRAGLPVALIERPNPSWPVSRANEILYNRTTDLALTLELAAVPGLSASWAGGLRERARRLREMTKPE